MKSSHAQLAFQTGEPGGTIVGGNFQMWTSANPMALLGNVKGSPSRVAER